MTSLPIFLSIFFTRDTKIILRISGLPKLNIFRFLFWRIFSNRIFKITCPTKATYDNLIKIKLFDYNKVVLLKDPVISLNEFRTKKYKKLNSEFESKKFILSIGRLTKQKNFELLINSFSIIIKKFPYYNLLIIGEGEYRNRLNKLIINKNLSEKVFLLGYKKNVYKYLKKADFFILTSLWEDPGFVILEAALSNTNIISSDCPNGPREIIKNQDFLFKNNSVEDLVNNFEKIKKKPPNDLFMQKILVKKEIKSFSIYQHFKNLKLILT
jgi:glycosyltransferase involved in cell wall biosynthesis